jgi:hypothetical protein
VESKDVSKTSKYTERNGTVYLRHFCPPYKHAGHYVGFVKGGARAVRQRLDRHLAGQGARLIEVAALEVVRLGLPAFGATVIGALSAA